jgi:geranylgeranyl diphosphate synthase type II
VSDLSERMERLKTSVNLRLVELIESVCEPGMPSTQKAEGFLGTPIKDAMMYSLMAGGKRLRPVMCLLSAGMFGDEAQALDIACAIEMIHTYSLIHDDLPAMDNDDLRRGKPTNHVVFGEAYAILAGDGLLNSAFEVMLGCARRNSGNGLDYISAMETIAVASGTQGMIAGQVADMEFEGTRQDKDVLEYIHERKTAALIKASVISGAKLFGINREELSALETYGACVGLVFQLIDDILDETGTADSLGKTPGKDFSSDKQTFARLYGIEASMEIARRKTDEAVGALKCFGDKAYYLASLAEYLLNRTS